MSSPPLQPEVDSFCVCLATWGVFLDHLIMMSSGIHGGQSPPTNNHYERSVTLCVQSTPDLLDTYFFLSSNSRYQDVLVCMMDSVVKKMLLHHNIDELREIDDDAVDDDVREGRGVSS